MNIKGPAILLPLLAVLCLPAWAFDCGTSPTDICAVTSSFDDATDTISVWVLLADRVDYSLPVKYRVHFDHTAPFYDEADRNGDGKVNKSDACASTSDVGMLWMPAKGLKGPGLVTPDGNLIRFEITLAELGLPIDATQIHIWSDVHVAKRGGGIVDRFPSTDDFDGCDEPETEVEAKTIYLPGYQLACPCWDGYTKGEILALLNDRPTEPGRDAYTVIPPYACPAWFCGEGPVVDNVALAFRGIWYSSPDGQVVERVEDTIAAGGPFGDGSIACVWLRKRELWGYYDPFVVETITPAESMICIKEVISLFKCPVPEIDWIGDTCRW